MIKGQGCLRLKDTMLKGISDYDIHNEHTTNGARTPHIVIDEVFQDLQNTHGSSNIDDEESRGIYKEDDDEVIDYFLFYFPLIVINLFISKFPLFPLNHDIMTCRHIFPIL